MKLKIASYKNSKSFFGWLIRFKQKYISGLKEFSKFSHSEIVFCYTDDEDVLKRIKNISLNLQFWQMAINGKSNSPHVVLPS